MLDNKLYLNNNRVIQQLHTMMDATNRVISRGCPGSIMMMAGACCFSGKQQLLSLLIVSLTILSMSHDCHTATLPSNIASNPNINNQFNPYMMTRPQSTNNNLFLHRIPPPPPPPAQDQVGSQHGQTLLLATSTNAPPIMNPSQMQPPPATPSGNLFNQNLQLNQYTKASHEILLDLRQQILTRSIKFDEHFRNLLSCSKLSLHNMFADTYGLMYEHNTEIFTGMFEGLEQYYANGQIKLTKSMENFFERLYQKIFQVYNSNMAFAPVYLDCATEQLAHLKPFKDVPEKLIDGIRHAFVAARTFVQALNNGIDIIKSIISLVQPAQCTHMINEKLLKNHNPFTTGNQQQQTSTQSRQQPCLGFCEQVISRCFGNGNLEALNEKWRGYVVILGELAMKLSTSYNIETIITPLDVQISEAIMNFQENAANISYHVFQVCGQPVSGSEVQLSTQRPSPGVHRIRRRATNSAASPMSAGISNQNRHNQHGNFANQWVSPPKDTLSIGLPRLQDDLKPMSQESPLLIDEIKNFMLSTKTFWHKLPNAVCTSNHTLGPDAGKKQTNCYQERFAFSDINTDIRYRVEMHEQIVRLDAMRSKIEKALEGIEIDWSSVPDQSRHPFVVPNLGAANPRLPLTTSTTSTTTTTPEPSSDDDDSDVDRLPDEIGSGDPDLISPRPEDDDYLDPDESTTESVTSDDENPENGASTEDPQSTQETPSQPNINNELASNSLDSLPQPNNNNDDILITPPNQAGAQQSSQSSNKLLIRNEQHTLLLVSLISIILFLLSSFRCNQKLSIT